MAQAGLYQAQRAVVTDDGTGIAPVLAQHLQAQGIAAQVVATAAVPADADWVVFLGGLQALADVDAALNVNRQAFQLAKTLAPHLGKQGGVFISVQDTGGDFGLAGTDELRAWTGGLPGLIKTAAQEWPQARLKAIDLNRAGRDAATLAAILADEILAGGPELEVALAADGSRKTIQLVAQDPQPLRGSSPLAENPVIIAAGGARGVTATTLIEFAKAFKPRLALLGRSQFDPAVVQQYQALADHQLQPALLQAAKAKGEKLTPKALTQEVNRILANREIAATLQAIAAAGGQARYLAVDVNDPVAVNTAVAEIRQLWGAVHGIVHGAGVLADAWIENKTVAQFERVFTTKIEGLRALLSATRPEERQLVALFSSVAARAGNTGQCDYSMANEILNKVADAEARKHPQHLVKSFNWGPWEGGMVTPELKNLFAQRGIALIPLQEGAELFVREIQSQPGQEVELVVGGESLQQAASGKTLSFQIKLDRQHHPYLLSHQVRNTPVLPMVIALEWFMRVARLFCPPGRMATCHEFQVRKGVMLDALDSGQWLQLNAEEISTGTEPQVALSLQNPAGKVHYSGVVQFVRSPAAQLVQEAPLTALQAAPWPALYSDATLFHGADFQVIRHIQGVSQQGLSATIAGMAAMGWPGGPWQTDAAALDGALQVAILWGLQVMGTQTLPMKISAFVPLMAGIPQGDLQCRLYGRKFNAQHTVSDILIQQQDGQPVAELRGVELYALPK